MDSRVGGLELTIRGQRPTVERLRPTAEAFAIRVLQRCDEMLDRRSPGRVFVLNHLHLSLRSVAGALEDSCEIDGFAAEIADHLERTVASVARADSDDDVAVFADEAAWRAAHVETHLKGSAGEMWKFAPLDEEGEPLRALVLKDRPQLLRDVLVRLHQHGALLKILGPLPEDVLAAIARALGRTGSDGTRVGPASEVDLPEPVVRYVREVAPTASLNIGWIAIATATRDALGPSRAETDVCNVAQRGFSKLLAHRSTRAMPIEPGGAGDSVSDSAIESDRPGERGSVASELNGEVVLGAQLETADRRGWGSSVASEFGGVFYLLRLAIEVSLGESMWRACLPEGIMLSKAIGTLLGDEAADDPAPLLFGGVQSNEALPPISAEQQHEVSHAVFAALVDALLRRELIASCEPVLHLVDTAHGRLLVASSEPGPYVLFALPANSRDEIVAALDSLLAIWPPSAPRPRAGHALAALDRRGRIRSRSDASPNASALVAGNEDSLYASALLTQAAGTLGYLFAARLGLEDQPARDLVTRYFRIPALIETTSATLDVRIPMEALNLDVRRAGLDADPGWIPWLGRRVSLTFEDQTPPDSPGVTRAS